MAENYYNLSFDVGTKNLAYSLCKYYKTDDPIVDKKIKMNLLNFKILEWDVFDIHHVSLKCKQIKNKRALCNKNCLDYILKNDTGNKNDHTNIDNINGYCKGHAKSLRNENNTKKKKNTKIKNKIIQLEQKSKKLDNKSILTNIDTLNEYKIENITNLYKIKNNNLFGDSLDDTSIKLIIKLDQLFNRIKSGYEYNSSTKKISKIINLRILIENQPTLRQNMKSVSILIYMYFQMKKNQFPGIIGKVNFINAITKTNTTFIKDMYYTLGIKSSIDSFLEYGKRKTFAQDIIQKFVFKICSVNKDMASKVGQILIRKKKDDLADAMLYIIRECFYNI
jgi:hypothetical protein